MLEKIVIASLGVFAIWYTMQPKEVFGFIEEWWKQKEDALLDHSEYLLETAKAIDGDIEAAGIDVFISAESSGLEMEADRLFKRQQFLEKISQPLFRCPVCMAPWYGSGIYWLVWGAWLQTGTWQEWVVVIISALGHNAIIVNFWPSDK